MCLTFNKRNANYPNRISRPSRSAQTYISRDFLARIHVLRSDSGERRQKEKREKKNDSSRTRTICALIARRRKKIRVPAVSLTGVLTSVNLSPLRGADSHALNLQRSRSRKCINSSWNCPREARTTKSRVIVDNFSFFFFELRCQRHRRNAVS